MIKTLKDLQVAEYEQRYKKFPSMPEYARHYKTFSDKTANGLTKALILAIQLQGGQAERISTTGRYIDDSKIVTDVVGRQRKLGTGKWIKGSGRKGSADISSTIRGRSLKIEVKIGRDKQSDEQIEYQQEIEDSGGIYIIAKEFEPAMIEINKIFEL